MLNSPNVLLALAILTAVAFGDDHSDRAKLIGTWQPQSNSREVGTWKFESKGTDMLRVTQSRGAQMLLELECTTNGQECGMTESGKPAIASLYFNDAKLVELETKGRQVVKRRFGVAGTGDVLEVEIIPVVPAGKPELLRFERVQR